MSVIDSIFEKLQKGKAKEVSALVEQALNEGVKAEEILNDGLVAGMNVVGEKFRNNEVFVPEVLVAARAMNAGLKVLKPSCRWKAWSLWARPLYARLRAICTI